MKKATGKSSFAEMAISHRKTTNLFLEQVNQLIDWKIVEMVIDNYDTRGKGIAGNSAYPGLVLFKMSLLGIWYNLSDRALEDRVNDSISFNRFCGLSLSDPVPDHSVVSRFRTMMTNGGAWDGLLRELNRQLDEHGLLVKTGTIIDASITSSPRKPGGKAHFEIQEDRAEDTELEDGAGTTLKAVAVPRPGSDPDARWVKKAGKAYFGYKKHHATDLNGLVMAVETTSANVHDNVPFKNLIDRVAAPGSRCYADKGYAGQKMDDYLKTKRMRNGIQRKGWRNRPLTERDLVRNRLISKYRYKVERTFGGQVRWFGAGTARYVGLAATHAQHVLEAICYNLKRAPRLYIDKLKMEVMG